MKEITKKWLEFAKNDLEAAKILLNGSKKNIYYACFYYCHQSLEKNLKAILAERDQKIPKIHDLVDLFKKTQIHFPKEHIHFIKTINPYYNPIRYPDSIMELKEEFTKVKTKKIYQQTKEAIKWMQHELTRKN